MIHDTKKTHFFENVQKKLELMQINCDFLIYEADGLPIKKKISLKYLGALFQKSGRIDSEIGAKIGTVKSEFWSLK